MVAVTQGSQTRTFSYDNLSRLTSAVNPESGTISYTYDASGNLKTKRDARNVKTVYDYDSLNRITKRCYRSIGTGSLGMTTCTNNPETQEPNTSDVSYTYENTSVTTLKGLLTKVANGVSVTEYTDFDALGRIERSKQTTDGVAYNEMQYTYNLAGALIEQVYPSGRKVKNVIDNAGELKSVQSKKNDVSGPMWTYARNFLSDAAGIITSMELGNGRWESTVVNNRLQPTRIALGTTVGATDLLKLDYSYGKWESGSLDTLKNNGKIGQQVITVPNGGSNLVFTQKYDYDALNRIVDATETSSSQTWRQAFLYDRYGNRTFSEGNTTTLTKACGGAVCPADRKIENPSISSSTNRIVQDQDGDTINDYTFDSSGNTTKVATGLTFVYDGDNKQTEVWNGSQRVGRYWYDGDGKRIKKEVYENGQLVEITIFVYDATSRISAEYSTRPSDTPQVLYVTPDSLGSPRINTDRDGTVIGRHDYHPFGEEITTSQRVSGSGYNAADIRKKFTGYERDGETDLNFAQARYQNEYHGRFTSPDPMMASASKSNPQTFNRYSYVMNDPLNISDPSGLCPPVDDKPCKKGDVMEGIYEDGQKYKMVWNGEAWVDKNLRLHGGTTNANEQKCWSCIGAGSLAAATTTTAPRTTTPNLGNQPPGGPLARQGPGGAPATRPSAARNFGGKIGRAPKMGGVTFAVSILAEELINPSQTVGNDTCDAVPDGCKVDDPSDIDDDETIVRGGTTPIPSPGVTFSGAFGDSIYSASQGVPHGQVQYTTAGQIRAGGGVVIFAPEECYPGGPLNPKHVNIILGPGGGGFQGPIPNPVPKKERVPGRP